jgi:hypothetical protein
MEYVPVGIKLFRKGSPGNEIFPPKLEECIPSVGREKLN